MNKKYITISIFSILFLVLLFFILSTSGVFPWFSGILERFTGREPAFCFENDDGADYYHRGITYGRKSNGEIFKNFDYCEDNILKEWYCESLNAILKDHVCVTGCLNGACKI